MGTATLDTVEARQGSAPSSPAAGKVRLYWKSGDPTPYIKDSAGVERAVLLDSVPAANKVLLDNQNEAWAVIEGTNRYFVFKTTDGAEETIVGADPAGVATAKLTLRAGSAGVAMTSTGPIDIDAAGSLGLNSSGGPINIGDDAVNQPINIGTQGTRTITRGSATATIAETAASFTYNVKDNAASPFSIVEGARKYYELITTDGQEEIKHGNATTNPKHTFLGGGLAAFGGGVTITGTLQPGVYSQVAGTFTYNVAGSAYSVSALSTTLVGVGAAANAVRLNASNVGGGIDVDYGTAGIDFAGTGAFVVNLADNSASIYKVQEGANVYILISTVDGSEKITLGSAGVAVSKNLDVDGTVTTKLGQSANPAMGVDGTLYVNDVASAEVANTNAETAFNKAPNQLVANTLAALRRLKVRAAGVAVDTNAGGQQLTIRIRALLGAGPTTVTLATLTFNANDGDTWAIDYNGHVLNQGTANSRNIAALVRLASGAGAMSTLTSNVTSPNLDTTQPITIQVSAQWQNMHVDNRARLDYLEVELG